MNLVERKAADRDARADLRAVGRLQWPWVHWTQTCIWPSGFVYMSLCIENKMFSTKSSVRSREGRGLDGWQVPVTLFEHGHLTSCCLFLYLALWFMWSCSLLSWKGTPYSVTYASLSCSFCLILLCSSNFSL
jgi:hypothetical protein